MVTLFYVSLLCFGAVILMRAFRDLVKSSRFFEDESSEGSDDAP